MSTVDKPVLSLEELDRFDPHPKTYGRHRRFCCPFCGQSKPVDTEHQSLAVETDTGLWICHRCSRAGMLKEFWTDTRPDKSHALRAKLKSAFRLNTAKPDVTSAEFPDDIEKIKEGYEKLLPLYKSPGSIYLENRGIWTGFAEAAGVKFAPNFAGAASVVFPIKDLKGNLAAVQGRAIAGSQKRTYGQKRLGVFSTELGLESEVVIITEAPIDALSFTACGYHALALIGTTWPEWLPKFCAFKKVYLATDNDPAGEECAVKLKRKLEIMGAKCRRLTPLHKDWNETLLSFGDIDGIKNDEMPQMRNLLDKLMGTSL